MDRSIAFGFFGALGKIARNVLETFYGWTGNYGVAIIMMTILATTNLTKISKSVNETLSAIKVSKDTEVTIELSKNGKNVVVVIFDRGV